MADLHYLSRVLRDHSWQCQDEWARAVDTLGCLSEAEILEVDRLGAGGTGNRCAELSETEARETHKKRDGLASRTEPGG